MEVSSFFARLLQAPKGTVQTQQPDDLADFDSAWQGIQSTLTHPDERQLVKGIASTAVPDQLKHIIDALVYEENRGQEDTTGACLEYFLRNDLLTKLERLCEADRPFGIKAEVLRAMNNLVVLLSERFLVHNAVHRPLRRLLRSCVGDEPDERLDGSSRTFGAAGMEAGRTLEGDAELEGDLVDLMCNLCSKMRAYPPLLLIFFHDKGWLVLNPSDPSSSDPSRTISPTPSHLTSVSNPSTRDSHKVIHHFEFLLFSANGDFARAGLLFLFDIAFLTAGEEGGDNLLGTPIDGVDPLQEARDALAEYILDGDFADVMAAGLGAIFSLLPSKLMVPSLADQARSQESNHASTSGGMHLGFVGDQAQKGERAPEHPSSNDDSVRSLLDLLLKLFGFLQDIIFRCDSPRQHTAPDSNTVGTSAILGVAISDATLNAMESSFLDNVLYPSILECSFTDGSSVAVLTYLDVLFSNLDDGPLLQRIIDYLMDSPESTSLPDDRRPNRISSGLEKVQSTRDYFAAEGKFTLKDLILDNLRPTSSTSSTAALGLLRTLLTHHCRQSLKGLLTVVRDPAATALAPLAIRSMSGTNDNSYLPSAANFTDMHLQEVELYGSLISRIDSSQTRPDVAAGYSGYLTDIESALQADQCYRACRVPLNFRSEEANGHLCIGQYDRHPFQHRMRPSDPLIRKILQLFGRYFCHTPDENVALTGVISAISLCPNRSLAGWLLYDKDAKGDDPWALKAKGQKYLDGDDESDGDSDMSPSRSFVREDDPFMARASVDLPAIYQIVRDLVKQISSFRNQVENFDRLLSERRQGLLFADHLDEAMNLMLGVESDVFGSMPSNQSTPVTSPPKRPRPNALSSSIRSFLSPRKKSSTTVGQVTPTRAVNDHDVSPSPFKQHYEATATSMSTPAPASIATGPWSPSRQSVILQTRASSALSHHEFDNSFVRSEDIHVAVVEEEAKDEGEPTTSLTILLDNCVILEEFIKEIVSIITARRALGIDQVGFV